MSVNKRMSLAGLAKQTAKGAVATNPTYDFGVLSGSAFSGSMDQTPEEVTLATLTIPGVNRVGFHPQMDFSCRGYPALLGMLLLAALGADAVTGAGDPYTHTITDATDTPYFTLFGLLGTDYIKIADAKLDQLTVSWDGPAPIQLDASWLGCDFTWLGGAWTPTTTQRDTDGKYRAGIANGISSHFWLDVDATPAATAQPISKGQLVINNNIEQIILANSIKPADVARGERAVTAQVTAIINDLLLWRRIFTGTPSGTAITETEVYGALEFYFAGNTANHDLKLTAPRGAFMGAWPAADPKGGPTELVLDGTIVTPSAGAVVTAALRNAVPSY